MIESKRLVKDLMPILKNVNVYDAGRIIGCIDAQENKCSDCSTKAFYQKGYMDGFKDGIAVSKKEGVE